MPILYPKSSRSRMKSGAEAAAAASGATRTFLLHDLDHLLPDFAHLYAGSAAADGRNSCTGNNGDPFFEKVYSIDIKEANE